MRRIEELLNKEMAFVELDNTMVENGFYSVLDDGIVEDIKRDRNGFIQGKKPENVKLKSVLKSRLIAETVKVQNPST